MKQSSRPKLSRLFRPKSLVAMDNTEYKSCLEPAIAIEDLLQASLDKLYQCYDSATEAFRLKSINQLIKNYPIPHCISLKDYNDMDGDSQHLGQYYPSGDHHQRFEEVIGYYVFYEDIPRLFIKKLGVIVAKNIENHRVIKYTALKQGLGMDDSHHVKNPSSSLSESKCLPTGINDETDSHNSLLSVVKQLSILIAKEKTNKPKHCLTEGCLTLLRSQRETSQKSHRLVDVNTNVDRCKQNYQTSPARSKVNTRFLKTVQSVDRKQKLNLYSSRRRNSKNKSIESFTIHSSQKKKSPEPFHFSPQSKKKHVRMYSNQLQLQSTKQSRPLCAFSYEHLLSSQAAKPKNTFLKKKIKLG